MYYNILIYSNIPSSLQGEPQTLLWEVQAASFASWYRLCRASRCLFWPPEAHLKQSPHCKPGPWCFEFVVKTPRNVLRPRPSDNVIIRSFQYDDQKLSIWSPEAFNMISRTLEWKRLVFQKELFVREAEGRVTIWSPEAFNMMIRSFQCDPQKLSIWTPELWNGSV